MKIAFFTDTYKPQVNGVTYSIDFYVNYLKNNGHSVFIYSPNYTDKETFLFDNLKLKTFFSLSLPTYKDIKIAFPNLYTIVKDMLEFNPDIIHVQSPGNIGLAGMIVSKILKIPLVCTFHIHPTAFTKNIPLLSRSGKKVEKVSEDLFWEILIKVFQSCNLIICPTQNIKNEILQRSHIDQEKLTVLANGIDIREFSPADYGQRHENSLLYLGRISIEKNIEVLLQAFKPVLFSFPNAKLTIVGDGPYRSKIVDYVERNNLEGSVVFTGFVKHEDTVKYYRENRLFITASPHEVQPMVVLESLACGTPVLGVKDSGVDSIIVDGFNGVIVSNSDPKEITEKIIQILSDNKLQNNLSINARESVSKFDICYLGKTLENIYDSIIRSYDKS